MTKQRFRRRLKRSGLRIAMLLGAALISHGGAAHADEATYRVSVPSLSNAIPVYVLPRLQSEPGEAKKAFLLRVAAIVQDYTAHTGFEACGRVFSTPDGTSWAVPLTTNKAHAGCVITDFAADDLATKGFSPTPDSIHSHPDRKQAQFRANSIDSDLLNHRIRSGAMLRGDGETFSAADLAGGPGYLVTGGRLLHQNGPQTIQDLGPIDLDDTATVSDATKTSIAGRTTDDSTGTNTETHARRPKLR